MPETALYFLAKSHKKPDIQLVVQEGIGLDNLRPQFHAVF
jgi:hypothetical protein